MFGLKLNWHTLFAALASGLGWVAMNVNPAAIPHNIATILGVAGLVVATVSKPAVQSPTSQTTPGG